jgi:hypothetical protein
LSYN